MESSCLLKEGASVPERAEKWKEGEMEGGRKRIGMRFGHYIGEYHQETGRGVEWIDAGGNIGSLVAGMNEQDCKNSLDRSGHQNLQNRQGSYCGPMWLLPAIGPHCRCYCDVAAGVGP